MLPTHRFNELIPIRAANRAEPLADLPLCALDAVDHAELDGFPAFGLMRQVRDWVEGEDQAGAGIWSATEPMRLYENLEHVRLCATDAVVGHLCLAPDDSRLSDATLLHAACRRYWGPAPWAPVALLERTLTDERPPGWALLAPWWRASAMFRHHSVELAAVALHYLWEGRDKLDLARLADETAVDGLHGSFVRLRTAPPPFHLRTILTGVLGPNDAAWPAFERAMLIEFDLSSDLADAQHEASHVDCTKSGGLSDEFLVSN